MTPAQEKEVVRQELVNFTLNELRARPVLREDVNRFARFSHPKVLQLAIGRPLTDSEAVAIVQHLQLPAFTQSMQSPVQIQSDLTCDCKHRQCAECSASPFQDTSFHNRRGLAPTTIRTGIINNPPFSIFEPVDVSNSPNVNVPGPNAGAM